MPLPLREQVVDLGKLPAQLLLPQAEALKLFLAEEAQGGAWLAGAASQGQSFLALLRAVAPLLAAGRHTWTRAINDMQKNLLAAGQECCLRLCTTVAALHPEQMVDQADQVQQTMALLMVFREVPACSLCCRPPTNSHRLSGAAAV